MEMGVEKEEKMECLNQEKKICILLIKDNNVIQPSEYSFLYLLHLNIECDQSWALLNLV